MSEIDLLEYPGKQLSFELELETFPVSQQDAARSAVEGLDLFCRDFVMSLSGDLALSYYDAEFSFHVDEPKPVQRFWFLKSEDAPADASIGPLWVNANEQSVPAITPETILEWMMSAMAQSPQRIESADKTCVVGWKDLFVRATRVRLPRSDNPAPRESLQIHYGTRITNYPIEQIGDDSFVSGPLQLKFVTGPIDLHINNETGAIKLSIGIHWSLWTEPHQEGWTDIRTAVQRLQQNGWKCTYSGINLKAL